MTKKTIEKAAAAKGNNGVASQIAITRGYSIG